MAEHANRAASKLNDLINDYTNVDEIVAEIKKTEHECDQVFHRIMHQLNKSFVTPIDREDINLIASELDNITDTIEDAAHGFRMFNVTNMTDDAKVLSDLILKGTIELKAIILELKNMKTTKLLKPKVIEVNRLENEGDDICRSAMTTLFSGDVDTLEVIKWKQIYEILEGSLDACEKVATTVASGFVNGSLEQYVIVAALLAGIIWDLLTWYYGIPSSSSHALIGGLVGASIVYASSIDKIIWKNVLDKVVIPLNRFYFRIYHNDFAVCGFKALLAKIC